MAAPIPPPNYTKKKFLYYTEVRDDNGYLLDQRVSFSPNQYVQLKKLHEVHDEPDMRRSYSKKPVGERVHCRRMDLVTGEWRPYPSIYARK